MELEGKVSSAGNRFFSTDACLSPSVPHAFASICTTSIFTERKQWELFTQSSDLINYDCSCSTPSNICFAQHNPGSYTWKLHFERVKPIEIYYSPSHFLQEEFNWAILGHGLHSWMYLVYHFEVRESSMMRPWRALANSKVLREARLELHQWIYSQQALENIDVSVSKHCSRLLPSVNYCSIACICARI